MDVSYLIDSLNDQQREAVASEQCNMLILAGAGSGKTRVLVHRIAWLMSVEHISPYGILAVTFTNKAAYEMRGRIEALRGTPVGGMWVGTFHGLAHRVLRAHWEDAKLPETFQIMDGDDQYRLIRRILRSLDLDEAKWPPRQAQWFINKSKEEGRRAKDISNPDYSYFTETMQRVYTEYEAICERSGLVDFSELLLRSLELFRDNEIIREHYQSRFQQILVDEFQDTNTIQYAWLKMLKAPHANIMAVGDDDQSIYSWRGAKVENMQRFTKEMSDVKTIRLEQNYRSTQTILAAANTVIANNEDRLGKDLWTDGEGGDQITLYAAFNERDEAYYIASTIRDLVRQGYDYNEVGILYRSNAQSRILEEQMLDQQIPYRIYGGQKFFERAEIKDALAYLRVIANRHDDAAFERIVNTPTRGIGNTTLNKVREQAQSNKISLWDSVLLALQNDALSGRATSALEGFVALINELDASTEHKDLDIQTDQMLHKTGLLASYQKDRSEKGISRVENLEELIVATNQFKPDENEDTGLPLNAFLSHVALETGEGQADSNSNAVNMMTLHSAKGLEFPIVFIAGMEEDLFPHKMSVEEARGLEEERRLCYVGMTRAMQKLYLTYAESRRLYGTERINNPSRFIAEIPPNSINAVRPTTKIMRPSSTEKPWQKKRDYAFNNSASDTGLKVGQRVKHSKFGVGTIVNFEGSGEHARLQVKFDTKGTKWLVASFANLTPA
jgi:DNA helicase-2/ATP-dependent DNA helicase PcrA